MGNVGLEETNYFTESQGTSPNEMCPSSRTFPWSCLVNLVFQTPQGKSYPLRRSGQMVGWREEGRWEEGREELGLFCKMKIIIIKK